MSFCDDDNDDADDDADDDDNTGTLPLSDNKKKT